MSEDDIVPTIAQVQYVAKKKHWRSEEATAMLRAMDIIHLKSHFNPDGSLRPGCLPRLRITGTVVSSEAAPTGLPRNCYSQAFLNSLDTVDLELLDIKDPVDLSISPQLQQYVTHILKRFDHISSPPTVRSIDTDSCTSNFKPTMYQTRPEMPSM